MSLRQNKVANELKKLTSAAITNLSNRQSIITVTRCDVSPTLKKSTIFVTVLPESEERKVIPFLERHLVDIRSHVKKNWHGKIIPFFDIQLDKGEKNRQRIFELAADDKKD